MRRTGLVLGGVLTLALAGLSYDVTAATPDRRVDEVGPAVRTIEPMALGRGPDAAIDHLQDGVIHTASGKTVRVRIPYGLDQLALLGRSGSSWLVAWGTDFDARGGYQFGVSRVRAGHRPVAVPKQRLTTYGEDFHSWRLDRDGSALVSTTYDRGGATTWVRDVTTGQRLDDTYSGVYYTPFDVADGHVAGIGENERGGTRVVDWEPGVGERTIAKRASYVSLRRDLVFVRVSGRDFGPTSVATPGTPAWSAPFQPLDVSPDGTTAVGLRISRSGFDDRGLLEVRAMDDGRLLDAIDLGDHFTMENWSITSAHEQTVRWESDSAYVVQLKVRGGAVLVRCRIGGRCDRASDVGGNISTPYEYFMWPQI